MTRRPRRIIPATVAALILVAIGVYAAVIGIGGLLGDEPTGTLTLIVDRVSNASWNDPAVLAVGAGLLVIGLVLLLCAVLPGRPQVLALTSDEHSTAGVTRASISHAVQDAADSVDRVSSSHAQVKGRRVDVHVQAAVRDTTNLNEEVTEAVGRRLGQIPLVATPRITVRSTGAKD